VLQGWGCRFLLVMTLVTLEVLMLVYFFATVPRTLRDVRVLLYTAVVATAFVALCIPLFPSKSGVAGGGKMVVTPFVEVNMNTIGYVLGTIGALTLGMAVSSSSPRTRLGLSAAVFVCLLILVLTKSRGAWLGFGVAFVYVLLKNRSLGLLLLAAVIGLAIVMSDVLRAMLVSRVRATTAYDPSLLGRFLLWNYAWYIGKANWLFGVGMENFRYVKHFYRFPSPLSAAIQFNAHNLYFEMFVDLGIIGLLSFVWLLVSSFLRAFRSTIISPNARDLGTGLSAGLVAYATHGLFDCVLFQQGAFVLFGVLAGLSMSLRRLSAPGTGIGRSEVGDSLFCGDAVKYCPHGRGLI